MKLNIAVLPGDGIGPEISAQGVDVMSAVCKKFGHEVRYEYALCGADAIDKVGDPFPEETYRICKEADARPLLCRRRSEVRQRSDSQGAP